MNLVFPPVQIFEFFYDLGDARHAGDMRDTIKNFGFDKSKRILNTNVAKRHSKEHIQSQTLFTTQYIY